MNDKDKNNSDIELLHSELIMKYMTYKQISKIKYIIQSNINTTI